MNNDFTQDTRELFDRGGYLNDWEDGRNDANTLHHILKRVSNSPYNSAPLNNSRNHMPESRASRNLLPIHSPETRKKFLQKTKRFLNDIGYEPTKEDLEFLNKYKKYYE